MAEATAGHMSIFPERQLIVSLADRAKQELITQQQRALDEAAAAKDEIRSNFEERAVPAIELVGQRWFERMGVEPVPVTVEYSAFVSEEEHNLVSGACYADGYFALEGRRYRIRLRMRDDGTPVPAQNHLLWHLVEEFNAEVRLLLTPTYSPHNTHPRPDWRAATTLDELGRAFNQDQLIQLRNRELVQ